MSKLLIIAVILLGAVSAKANQDSLFNLQDERSCVQTIHWGIILSTKDYTAAFEFAEKAAKTLDMEFSTRGYIYSAEEMLADTAECGCGMVHGYIPRGRYDNGDYLSIEIKGDYYVVVVTSGLKEEEGFQTSMDKARAISKDAYVLNQEVWMCCMH